MLLPVNESLSFFSRASGEKVLAAFSVGPNGLSSNESLVRQKNYGKNELQTARKKHSIIEVLEHFKSPLIIILLAAAVLSFSLGQRIDATIIFFMVLISVAIDYWQEKDARNAAERLKATVKSRVTVIREGIEKEVSPEDLCHGDIILLNAGKIIPADCRLLEAKDLFVNQSSLTGESFPCEKYATDIPDANEDLTTLDNILFMGSSVITGFGKAVVIKIGSETQFGKIASRLINVSEETDFSRGIRSFGFLIMRVTIILVLFIFLVNSLLKHNFLESFMFSLAVAVGLTPELLPMVMSVTMAKGSLRMAKQGVVVKKLTAIPNFGSMDVLCTDKTGTLTEDKIRLVKYTDPEGNSSEELLLLTYLNSFYQSGIRNPLDDAVIEFRSPSVAGWEKEDEIPFDFVRKRMSVVVKHNGRLLLICKGAPEEIMKVCKEDSLRLNMARQQYEALSAEGYRVLAVAIRDIEPKVKYNKQEEQELKLCGFASFLDPPKQDADETIAALQEIGVEVKIITGDNHLVTQKICSEIGLPVKGIMQGFEMDHLTDDALQLRARNTTIFSRFSPEQKNRIILALKKFHHAVGYMGDGINDAPSLKTADVGISVNSATDVAKDAADIILTHKDLLVLRDGIIEGRKTFGNTMKYVLMGLSSNFGNMFSVAAATLFLPFLPMLPAQILINNFLYDTSQVTIPTDNVDKAYTQKPQRWNLKMIYQYMLIFGLTSSLFDFATFYLLFDVLEVTEAQFRTGWFMESLGTQILVVFIIRTSLVPFIESKPGKYLVISVVTCLAIGWLLPYTGFATYIGFSPLPASVILMLIGLILLYLFTAELVKRFIYRRLAGKQT
ncbi:MAG TPA: magnesium-translocating P-type ATPase [Chitinophagaceae bacterium]|nr:magnesium-translocating P-type ATPase [Chitinophagaceae bacterium]